MIVDTSVIAAILFDEPEAVRLERAIAEAPVCRVSAATVLESTIVVESRFRNAGEGLVEHLLERMNAEIVPFDGEQARRAVRAWRRYGKGRHPAGLNLGDCFSYALAVATGDSLLFKGDDFAKTDVAVAPLPT